MATAQRTQDYFDVGGVTKLFWQSWTVANPKAVLVFVHGMAEHSGRYEFPVQYFVKKKYTVYAFDLRGHGQSEGRRVYADSFDDFVNDLGIFLKRVRNRESGKKIFLIGHSFGGQIVLNYGLQAPDFISGILVSSPNIRIKMPIAFYKLLLAKTLSLLVPTLTLGNDLDPRLVSHDPLVVRDYQQDPNVIKKITVRLAHVMMANQPWLLKMAHRFKLPCFLMHAGDDKICCPSGTEEFFENIPIKDKKLKIYQGLYHELFNEIDRETVFKDMEGWIEKRL